MCRYLILLAGLQSNSGLLLHKLSPVISIIWTKIFSIQWWFVNPGSDNPEISLIRTKRAGTDFRSWTDWRFSNPENSLIRKYHPGTNVSGLTNHHCILLLGDSIFPFATIYADWQQFMPRKLAYDVVGNSKHVCSDDNTCTCIHVL